jgi:K(+)-stimulated pyrophosphate-energized sodium pump
LVFFILAINKRILTIAFGGKYMNILGLARHGLNPFEQIAVICVVLVAFASLLYAWLLRGKVLNKDKGTSAMQEIWGAIRIGAESYLNRQLRTILPLIGLLTVALFLSVYVVPPTTEAVAEFGQRNAQIIVAIGRTIAFIMGASFSLIDLTKAFPSLIMPEQLQAC